MSTGVAPDHPPIYGDLIHERGDAVAAAQAAAAHVEEQAHQVLNWSGARGRTAYGTVGPGGTPPPTARR